MDAGFHLPLIDFGGEGFSYRLLAGTVDAAREGGFAAISANDHFVFSAPWLVPWSRRTRRSFAAGSASAPCTSARSCCPAMRAQAAGESTSGQ
jgi:hypothetical protein